MNFLNDEILQDTEWTLDILTTVWETLTSPAAMSADARTYGARETAESALASYPTGKIADMANAILAKLN